LKESGEDLKEVEVFAKGNGYANLIPREQRKRGQMIPYGKGVVSEKKALFAVEEGSSLKKGEQVEGESF